MSWQKRLVLFLVLPLSVLVFGVGTAEAYTR